MSKEQDVSVEKIAIITKPNRVLPPIIEDLISKDIGVQLSKDGYLIDGFYGIGKLLLQETNHGDSLLAIDNKGKKHLISSFEDLVVLNNLIWKYFFKKEEFKKPSPIWFKYLLDVGCIDIIPGK